MAALSLGPMDLMGFALLSPSYEGHVVGWAECNEAHQRQTTKIVEWVEQREAHRW
ncbi:MAG: hypothetical protein Q7U98_04285 [Methylicorpusculum sp.]|uniref:hypothetical protein n=1 Tax=Methylicorpusculum sp. TaxID=2713644 RepID=UPI0027196763|nr:hypothetical protein [Methylicorpusculum sp.]MDO8938355.1 hypothetical protein [Methylicorpusculum sp.]